MLKMKAPFMMLHPLIMQESELEELFSYATMCYKENFTMGPMGVAPYLPKKKKISKPQD